MNNNKQNLYNNKLSDIFKKNNKTLHMKAFDDLEAAYKLSFFKKILSFASLLPEELFTEIAEKSFAQALLSFGNTIQEQKGKRQKVDDEKQLLYLFKNVYHFNVAEKLTDTDVEHAIAFSLLQTNGLCKDYLTWHYIDEFTIEQISIITGKPLLFIKKELWRCRKALQENIKSASPFLPGPVIEEDRFILLTDYYENNFPHHSEEALVAQLNKSDNEAQKNDAVELLLRCRIAGNNLINKNAGGKKDTYLSASEFIEIAKQTIEKYAHKKAP